MREGIGITSVVVAEELALVRESLAALCESFGDYQVIGQCEDGAAAVQMIFSLKPDIAVLDLNLPRLFTLEAVRKVRLARSPCKLVILSCRQDRKTVIEALRAGASAYVLKPGPARHLLEAFRQIGNGGVYVSPMVKLEKMFTSRQKEGPEDPLDLLSTREYQVFSLLIDGVRAKEIAARLDLSPKTVDTYRSSLMRKLDIYDLAGLVKFAVNRSLTPPV